MRPLMCEQTPKKYENGKIWQRTKGKEGQAKVIDNEKKKKEEEEQISEQGKRR